MNTQNTHDLITEKIKIINRYLREIDGERGKANMKGNRNTSERLIANTVIRAYNKCIIEEADKVIEILKTDEYGGYKALGKQLKHLIIRHKEQFVDGEVHTNTITAINLPHST